MKSDNEKTQHANLDKDTVAGFGDEWKRFDQQALPQDDKQRIFNDYFRIFPWDKLNPDSAKGLDVGCGSGRWAGLVAPKVGHLHVLDASMEALDVAHENLREFDNVTFHHASVSDIPIADNSLNFAYSLGVLHHVPETAKAISNIAAKLKPGAPFLVYLYYAFDNRPFYFKVMWRLTELVRFSVSRLPYAIRYMASQFIALLVYYPVARTALLLDRMDTMPDSWPLSYYRDKPFYVMRTDALDRFGTRLEQRFTREQIQRMLEDAGFIHVRFSDHPPYWCAVAEKG